MAMLFPGGLYVRLDLWCDGEGGIGSKKDALRQRDLQHKMQITENGPKPYAAGSIFNLKY